MSDKINIDSPEIQVDASQYTTLEYLIPGRFASYSYQIKEILESGAQTVLEIGLGNGVVTYLLRRAGIRVDTLDHDPALQPDFVASIIDMPFPDNAYEAILCCQVLEHLPWEMVPQALQEISRVAKRDIVISIPHNARDFYIACRLPKMKALSFSISLPVNLPMQFSGEHYWEIGKGTTEGDVLAIFRNHNLNIKRSYRVPEFKSHHMFCLSIADD